MNYSDICHEIQQGTAGLRLTARVIRTITEIAEGRRRIAAIQHPLGFVCLPIQRVGDYGICVHLWTADRAMPEPTTSPVHSHSWDLLSYVLYGEVRNQLVHVTDTTAAPTHRVFEIHSDDDLDEIRPTGRLVLWMPGPAQSTVAGKVYVLAAGKFHMTVVPDEAVAATVVLGRTRPDMVDLSLGNLSGRTHWIPRQRWSELETARAARLVARRLADNSTGQGMTSG